MIIEIFQDKSGREPFVNWLNQIKNTEDKLRIRNRIRRIELDNLGDYKSLGAGLYELRFSFGAGYRIYFTFRNNHEIILLLIGGDKSSQKKDIESARKFLEEIKND
jgi:putative addiction module killer protein